MKTPDHPFLHAGACAFVLGLATLLTPLAASAATKAELAELRALHQRELADCRSGRTGQALSACLREAHASYAQAQRGGLDNGAAAYAANARQRCNALSGSDKSDCLDRMAGHGTVSGSVESGGMLRELTTYSVGARPAASAPPPKPRPVPVDPPR